MTKACPNCGTSNVPLWWIHCARCGARLQTFDNQVAAALALQPTVAVEPLVFPDSLFDSINRPELAPSTARRR